MGGNARTETNWDELASLCYWQAFLTILRFGSVNCANISAIIRARTRSRVFARFSYARERKRKKSKKKGARRRVENRRRKKENEKLYAGGERRKNTREMELEREA